MIGDGQDERCALAPHFRPPDAPSVMSARRDVTQGGAFDGGFDDIDLDDRGEHQGREAGEVRHEQAKPQAVADTYRPAFVLELGPTDHDVRGVETISQQGCLHPRKGFRRPRADLDAMRIGEDGGRAVAALDGREQVRRRCGGGVERGRLRCEQQRSEQIERTMHRGHLRDGEIAPAEGMRGGVADAEQETRDEADVRPGPALHRHERRPEQEARGEDHGGRDFDGPWTKRVRA